MTLEINCFTCQHIYTVIIQRWSARNRLDPCPSCGKKNATVIVEVKKSIDKKKVTRYT